MNFRSDNLPKLWETVKIRSISGPEMLVLDVDTIEDKVLACWYDLAMNYHEQWFPNGALNKTDVEPSGFVTKSGLDFSNVVKNLEFQSCIREGRKIQAIKVARSLTGLGLKESKDFVEEYEVRMNGAW